MKTFFLSIVKYPVIALMFVYFTYKELGIQFPFAAYYTKRTLAICTYVYTIYLAITLFIIPAFSTYFTLYGGWSTFGLIMLVNLMSFASSFGFFCIRRPLPTQATHKGATPC